MGNNFLLWSVDFLVYRAQGYCLLSQSNIVWDISNCKIPILMYITSFLTTFTGTVLLIQYDMNV